MNKPKIEIKAEGEHSQAAYNIFNKSIYLSSFKYSDAQNFCDWMLILSGIIILVVLVTFPFAMKDLGVGFFALMIFSFGFFLFLIFFVATMFLHFAEKKSKQEVNDGK